MDILSDRLFWITILWLTWPKLLAMAVCTVWLIMDKRETR